MAEPKVWVLTDVEQQVWVESLELGPDEIGAPGDTPLVVADAADPASIDASGERKLQAFRGAHAFGRVNGCIFGFGVDLLEMFNIAL